MTPTRIVVAGAGITGLTLAFTLGKEAERLRAAVDVTVIDAATDAGGHARTINDGEWTIEAGPNGFLDREADTLALIEELGLQSRLVEASSVARRRFVVCGGQLCQVPESPKALFGSNAISWAGKLRLLREPWAAAPPADADETVFAFAERRLGREAAETFVDTAVSGISAGDSRSLSVRSQFPILKQWERVHGSLLRAMLAQRKTSKGRTRLLSFDRGMGTLTSALSARLQDRMKTGSAITRVERRNTAWLVHLADGTSIAADHVVFTTPAHASARVVRALDEPLATSMASIPYSGLAVVALGYPVSALPRPLDGYGYLVTRAEELATLGVLWESSIFPGRAPADCALLRVFLGGALRPEILERDDEELLALARAELVEVMGLDAPPLHHRVLRWPAAIAQYTVGHDDRVRSIRSRLALHPGLHACGTALDGVSFNHAIASAGRTARALASQPGARR